MDSAKRIFISYARRDGAEIARSLRCLLEAAHHTVWLDTARIRGGDSWSKEIEVALDNCDVLLAVLTPATYLSEICRAEHIWALDKHKLVIPVLATADPAVIPLYLKTRHYRKFPGQQAELLQDLGAEPSVPPLKTRTLRYDTIPSLPQNYIHRESALLALRNLVFTESTNRNIAVTAMAGMGGIGKTVLAIALCRDPAVQRAFPDGIAWVTMGREWNGDFVTQMHEVARALGEDPASWDSSPACVNRYRTILREKAALVVVDDVWNLEHLNPLLADSPRSRFLFTTRNTGIADFIDASRYSANLLEETEARELLSRWSNTNPLPHHAPAIIDQCGSLAAAISQIGALLRGASPLEWHDTLHALRHANIRALEERLPAGQKSFFKSLAVSVRSLDPPMRERYRKLAILFEDESTSLAILQILWAVDEAEARRTARYFVDRSLASWEDPSSPVRGIGVHDLQLDYLRAHFADFPTLALIHEAWRISAHVLQNYPEEFCSQMIGRLVPYQESIAVSEFTTQLRRGAPSQWLMPLWPSLDAPGASLVRTLVGHSGPIRGVALTADGKLAVSASSDHSLKLWDLETGRVQFTFAGHTSCVNAVAITVDGKLMVSASNDNTLKVWDIEFSRELRTLQGHSGYVVAVALSADGKGALSGSWDHTLKVWDVDTGNEIRTLAGHSNLVTGVALSADGKQAVSASADKTLKVWDVETGVEIHTLAGHSEHVRAVALTPDGKRAVSASSDKTLKVWDVRNGRELRTLTGHSGWVRSVALTDDGKRAVSVSYDNTLKLWDLESGRELRTLPGHSEYVSAVALTKDGRRAVSASEDKTLKVWEVERRSEERASTAHGPVSGIAVTADRTRAVFPAHDHTLKILDLGTNRVVGTFANHTKYVAGIALAQNGKIALSACLDTLKVWDVETGAKRRTLVGHAGSITAVALTAAGNLAVSASYDKTLKVWDVESGCELHTLSGHSESVLGVALPPEGKTAISCSADKTLKVWDIESGRVLNTLAGHSAAVTGVALEASGRLAVSCSADKTLRVWDVDSGLELGVLNGHSARVNAVALTPDGQRAVSAAADSALKVWDVVSAACLATFHCDGAARCCSFVSNDRILAGDAGGRLYLLSLESPVPITRAASR